MNLCYLCDENNVWNLYSCDEIPDNQKWQTNLIISFREIHFYLDWPQNEYIFIDWCWNKCELNVFYHLWLYTEIPFSLLVIVNLH